MLPPLVILVGTWSFSDTVAANYWSLYFESLNIVTSRNLYYTIDSNAFVIISLSLSCHCSVIDLLA